MHFQGVGTESGLSFTIWNILYKMELTKNYDVGWMIMSEIISSFLTKCEWNLERSPPLLRSRVRLHKDNELQRKKKLLLKMEPAEYLIASLRYMVEGKVI